MDYKAIEGLIKTMSDSQLTSLEIEADGITIRMKKGGEPILVDRIIEKAELPAVTQVHRTEEAFERETVPVLEPKAEKTEAIDDITVTSPIVGTFYVSSSPDTDPFVKIGTKVRKGDVLCIIEAMKLMNEIEAEVDGEIVDILARNEQMVEYGQPLFRIRK